MSIITYPLNGVTYGAEDVSTYLCTRTSGIYAKESNFEISITGTREITVSPGLAWINYDDFCGVSVCSRENTVLTVPAADSTLTRIDRVVLQFDVDTNATVLKLKTGTPSAAPEPPAILQNHRQYELGLCTITVPGGSVGVTSADLTDTRLDEELCGIMRDGVTGIPTAQLLEQWNAVQAAQTASGQKLLDELEESIAKVDSNSFYTKTEADNKFGTPYTLPAATADTLGGVKVGAELDIAADGTISAESLKEELTETIAASVAVKSEARRVWDNYVSVAKKWTTATIEIPANVDYLDVTCKLNSCTNTFTIAKGSSTKVCMQSSTSSSGDWFDVSFVDGTLTITYTTAYTYAAGITLTGYHYPTLAELLAETQTAQEDTDALLVDQEYRLTLLELGVTE